MFELPYDIWLHITSFLRTEDVQELYSVNRVLFDIAMEERYQHACIGLSSKHKYLHRYAQIRDNFSAAKARHLVITSGPLYKQVPGRKSRAIHKRFLSVVNASRNRILGRLPEGRTQTDDMEKIMSLIPHLTSVDFLDIRLNRLEDPNLHSSKVEILKMAWPIIGSNLTTLILNTPLEDLCTVLVPVAKFPQLESLSVDIILLFRTSDGNALAHEILHPLIAAHCDTLQSLTLEQFESIDMTSILFRLPYMPLLATFRFFQTFVSVELTNISRLHQFLATQRHHLRQLDLHFISSHCLCPNAGAWYAQELAQIDLPKLDTLSIRLPFILERYNHPEIIRHLHRYLHTLTSLHFGNFVFSYDDTVFLLSGLHSSTLLRTLDILIFGLSPDILRLLADNLPNLHSLSLHAQYSLPFKDILVPYMDRVSGFCSSMETMVFPVWKLHSLFISPKTAQTAHAVLKALPELQFLCGDKRDEALALYGDIIDMGLSD